MLTKSKSLVLLVNRGSQCQPARFVARKLHSVSLARLTVSRVAKRARPVLSPNGHSKVEIRPIQLRFASSTPNQPSKPVIDNQQNDHTDQKSWKFANSINYTFAVAIGTVAGLITGYVLVTDSKQLDNVNELSRSLLQSSTFEPTKFVSRRPQAFLVIQKEASI